MTDTELSRVRGEMIAELTDLVKKHGTPTENAPGTVSLPVFKGEDGCDIFRNDTVYKLTAIKSGTRRDTTVTRLVVETIDKEYFIDELYADDIEKLLDFIRRMTEEDFKAAREWIYEL